MLKTSLRLAWRGLNHLTRLGLIFAALAVLACVVTLLCLRYWILPDIERYHGLITDSVSQAIGQPVSIGKIEADWSGLRPRLLFRDVHIMDRDRHDANALVLQQVEGVLSWTTLLTGSARLYSLEVDGPDLLIRRDAAGVMHIAGVALSGAASGGSDPGDWLLHQSRIVVRDARITWLDEQRGTPPLTFDRLNLRIQNRGRHHRFAVLAAPPPALSAQLDLRGDFYGERFDNLAAWHGEMYVRFDYADVSAWRTWLPLPDSFRQGRGALRGWLGVVDGQVNQFTADLALADVQAQLGAGLAPLDLRALRGRIAWSKSKQDVEISTQKLSLQMRNGMTLPPTDFDLRRTAATAREPAGGEVRANVLELTDLAGIADALPLEPYLKKQLADYAPRGRISDLRAKWEDAADVPQHYEVKARFDQLALNRVGKFPGFSGLSGELEGGDEKGTLSLDSRMLTVDAPGILPETWTFDALSGQGSWQKDRQGVEIRFSNVAVRNEDVAGTVYGSFHTQTGRRGAIDLNIDLTRASVHHAERYIPTDSLDAATQNWLRAALVDGQIADFHLRLRGDLDDFPFAADNRKEQFQIKAHIRDGVLEYDPAWPRIEGISADLLLDGRHLEVDAQSASTLGMHLQKVTAVVPDTTNPELRLQVHGEAAGETAHGLEFIQKSPVHDYIDGFTDDMTAHGNGMLQLALDIPLAGKKPATVSGSYRFIDNDLDVGNGVPALHKTNGELLFTESSMRTRNVSAQILGGPATLDVVSGADGAVQVKAHGHADVEALRRAVSSPWLGYLHGGSDWDANVSVQKKQATVLITSSLSGLVSDLPEPFSKAGGESVPLRFEIRSTAPRQDVVLVQVGKLLSARLLRREEGGEKVVRRGTVNFGGTGSRWINRDGVWLTGTLPLVSLDGWDGLFASGGGAAPFTLGGAELTIQKLEAYGYVVDGLRINARNQDGALSVQLASDDVNGEASWQPEGKGKLVAHLRNLVLRDSGAARAPQAARAAAGPDEGTEFPALNLSVDDLTWKGRSLGSMELLAQQNGHDWKLERLHLGNPDGALTVSGTYGTSSAGAQTDVSVKLEIVNAGKVLTRFGYPDSVKNGSGTLTGGFTWHGAPDEFDYATLNGWMALNLGKGQFLKIDPGIGKLLGILSLQALPSRITLDFTDVFSEGLAFNGITGTVQVRQGVMETKDFQIDGLSAKVTMQGLVDLNRETQNLRVRILPTVSNGVSVIGAFAAGPLVGLGTLVASKILRDPLDKLVSFEYNVTGTWSNPTVAKAGQAAEPQ